MSSLASYSYDVAIGVRTNTPAQLFSLLNTCVRYTNVAAIDEMLAQNSLVRDDTLAAMIDKLSTKTIAIIVFILACLIILLVAAIMSPRGSVTAPLMWVFLNSSASRTSKRTAFPVSMSSFASSGGMCD